MKTLRSHFFEELTGIYCAEQRIAVALPKMRKAGTASSLKQEILTLTEGIGTHLHKIEQIFNCFGRMPHEVWHSSDDLEIADFSAAHAYHAALDSALREAGQFEILLYTSHNDWEEASYHCLLVWAKQYGDAESAGFLEEMLDDDRKARAAKCSCSLGRRTM